MAALCGRVAVRDLAEELPRSEAAQSRSTDRRKKPPRQGPALLQRLMVCEVQPGPGVGIGEWIDLDLII